MALEDKILKIIADILLIDTDEVTIPKDSTLDDLGVDSLCNIEIRQSLEEFLEVDDFDDDEWSNVKSIKDILKLTKKY